MTDRLDDMARRMLGEAAALFAAGDLAGARSLAERAVVTSQRGRSRIEGLLLLAHIAWVDGTANAATEYLEEGLAEPGVDQALLGRIHAKLATYHMNPERVIRHADAAIQLLDEEHQPGLVAQVLIQKFYSQAVLGLGAQHDLLQRGLTDARHPRAYSLPANTRSTGPRARASSQARGVVAVKKWTSRHRHPVRSW
jgi:hypothetical protein